MKILYILNCFPSVSETFVLNEITGLMDLGHEVSIASLTKPESEEIHQKVNEYDLINKTTYFDDGNLSRQDFFEKGTKELFENNLLTKEERFRLLDLCYDKKYGREIAFRDFLGCLQLIKKIREEGIEHIHCHFAMDNVRVAHALHKIIGISYTFTTHAYDIFVDPEDDIKEWSDNAKKVIAVSEFNKKYMNENLNIDLEKMEVITYSKYLNKLKPIKDWQINPFKIISISRLTEKKGYPYLIEACKKLKEKEEDFLCEIQGEGEQREKLEDLINKYGLNDKIKLGSSLTHEKVMDFMETGSVFVLPCIRSKNGNMDGIPNVLMESMAKEIPTISTNLVGIPELIENNKNGILVEPDDSDELVQAILKIKNNKEFADKIRRKGREKVLDKFNVNKNVKKLVEVFER